MYNMWEVLPTSSPHTVSPVRHTYTAIKPDVRLHEQYSSPSAFPVYYTSGNTRSIDPATEHSRYQVYCSLEDVPEFTASKSPSPDWDLYGLSVRSDISGREMRLKNPSGFQRSTRYELPKYTSYTKPIGAAKDTYWTYATPSLKITPENKRLYTENLRRDCPGKVIASRELWRAVPRNNYNWVELYDSKSDIVPIRNNSSQRSPRTNSSPRSKWLPDGASEISSKPITQSRQFYASPLPNIEVVRNESPREWSRHSARNSPTSRRGTTIIRSSEKSSIGSASSFSTPATSSFSAPLESSNVTVTNSEQKHKESPRSLASSKPVSIAPPRVLQPSTIKFTPLNLKPAFSSIKPKKKVPSSRKSTKSSSVNQSTKSSIASKRVDQSIKSSQVKQSNNSYLISLKKMEQSTKSIQGKQRTKNSSLTSKKVEQSTKSAQLEKSIKSSFKPDSPSVIVNQVTGDFPSIESSIDGSILEDDLDRCRANKKLVDILEPPSHSERRAQSTPAKSSTARRSFSKFKDRPITKRKRKYYRDTQEIWKCKYCPHVCMLSEKRFHMVEHPAKIRKRLYLSDWKAAKDSQILKKLGITHILNCAKELNHSFENRHRFQILKLQLEDKSSQLLSQDFDRVYDFIHDCRTSGGKILVHCQQGISRSASFVAMYLMRTENCSFDAAMAIMSSKRHIVQPNSGFIRQLRALENKLAKKRTHGSRWGRGMKSSRANTPGPSAFRA